MQITVNHQTKAVAFGSALVVAMKEEVADGPYIQAMPSEILRYQLIALFEGLSEASRIKNSEHGNLLPWYLIPGWLVIKLLSCQVFLMVNIMATQMPFVTVVIHIKEWR